MIKNKKRKNKKHGKIVNLAKIMLNSIEILVSRALINSYISYDVFVPVNKMLKEYDDLKEE